MNSIFMTVIKDFHSNADDDDKIVDWGTWYVTIPLGPNFYN